MNALILGLVLAAASPLTLDQALKDARAKNLDIKVAQARLDQAKTLSKKVWANYLPQIAVGGSYTYNSAEAVLKMPTSYQIRDLCPDGAKFGQPGHDACMSGLVKTKESPYYGLPLHNDPEQSSGLSNPPGDLTSNLLLPKDLAEIPIQKHHQLGAQVSVSQAILAPALWPAIQSAYLGEEAATLGVETARREILFAVAQLYYGAVGAREALKVQQTLLETNQAHEKDAQVKVDAGAAPKVVLLRAQIDRTKTEADLRRAQNAYDSTRSALATLLDRDADFDVVTPEDAPVPADAAKLEEATGSRPDVQMAQKTLQIAENGALGAKLAYLPNVGVSGAWRAANTTGFTGESTSWFVTLGLNWTLWDGGLREAALKENDAKRVEAEYALKSAELKAKDEVRRALLDMQSAQENRRKAEETVKLARESQSLVEVGFKAGTSTYLEVADANAALLGAELGALAERLNAQLAVLKLAKAAGAFNPQ